jgi:type IV pilus assembly protein PilY1
MKTLLRSMFLTASLWLAHGSVLADDTDLFVRAGPNSDPPNVLFVIDNAGNFNGNAAGATCVIGGVATALSGKVGGIEQCALYNVIAALPADSVNIGIMVYNDSGVFTAAGTECVRYETSRPGGCLLYPITLMDATAKAGLLNWIRNWTTSGNNIYRVDGANKATGGVMQEAWAYYRSRTGVSGRTYTQAPPSSCNNYVIFIGNSYNNNGSPGDQTGRVGPKDALEGTNPDPGKNASPVATAAQRALITRTIQTTCATAPFDLGTNINNHENRGRYADEWSRYMKADDITTYSIGVLGPGCQAEYAAVLSSMAAVGGGKYFPTTNYAELVAALQAALSEMLAVNSVFASVSLPVSVNTQGTYLNQVYIGMFRPDRFALPRWAGNLKQYRLGLVDNALRLLDAQEPAQPAISGAGTGFISTCARSYWTPSADDTYWQIYKNDLPFCAPHPAVSNTPDGNFVEKGGQAYTLRRLPTATSIVRSIKTCSSASCPSTLVEFADANTAITKDLLGDPAMTNAARTDLINWARGQNNRGDETDPDNLQYAAATAMRPSAHGDVVHSRPVAINFGAPTDNPPKVVVFYGGNDGVLRAVNGNRTADIGTVPAGREMWSFIAPEFYPYIKRLRDNNTQISFLGNTTTSPAPQPKPYGFDGPLTSYTNAGDTWIFASMRRGGRMVYAFDVSSITTNPDSPTLKWRLGCPNLANDTGCTSMSITDIGQTWSSPTVLKSLGYCDGVSPCSVTDVHKPMLIMGGGYDPCEDVDSGTAVCTSSSKGNRIYVLDADNGNVLRSFSTDRGVVGEVFVVTNGTTGLAQWAYAADLGGNIYRISGADANTPFSTTAPSAWTITKIASLGCTGSGTCTPNRKFMFAPDVVVEPAPNSGTHILLIGSGDREKPLREYVHAYGVSNYFFMLKDVPSDSTWLSTNMGSCGSTICLNAMFNITGSSDPAASDLANKKGWYLSLNAHEQVVTSAITVFGGTTFSTHTPTVPDPDACTSDLGTARVYNLRYNNAAPSKPNATSRYEEISGGGLPPSPVAGQVKVPNPDNPDAEIIVPFIIGADASSPLEGGLPVAPSLSTLPKSITYWYIEK